MTAVSLVRVVRLRLRRVLSVCRVLSVRCVLAVIGVTHVTCVLTVAGVVLVAGSVFCHRPGVVLVACAVA